MEENRLTVKVGMCRYEELLDVETRVNVLIELASLKGYLKLEDMYMILGHKSEADKIKFDNSKEDNINYEH